jgi:hypothetical protein
MLSRARSRRRPARVSRVSTPDGVGDACDVFVPCPPTPLVGTCTAPVESQKAQLVLKDGTPDGKDTLTWKWKKGDVTPKPAFGDSTAGDGFVLCVYDGAGLKAARSPRRREVCRQGVLEGDGERLQIRRQGADADGIKTAVLKQGLQPAKASITVKGKGDFLQMPALDLLASPITVQLTAANGACWGAVYSAPFQTQTALQLRAKGD